MCEPKPGSGKLEGGVHMLPIRVYWEDTDAAGIVYYANYLKFFERGRTDLLRLVGIEQRRLKDATGFNFVVRRCEVDYLSSARLDDALEIETSVEKVRGASMDMRQTVRRDRDYLAVALIRIACIDDGGGLVRLPAQVKTALSRMGSCN